MEPRKKKISIIPATKESAYPTRQAEKVLRVAAYCRVSTLLEQQESSYEAQVHYYTDKIRGTPNWKFAGIYADDGKSATSIRKRSDFQEMIEDCMAGKIDLVLTKSISRFARNTVDALTNIRRLKEKRVAVFFEKEGINTLEESGELLLTILSSQAQEESRNISENCHWGIVRKFEQGQVIVNHNKFLGYTKDDKGNLKIVPKEAELVRKIFRLFLEGNSSYKIKRILEADGIKTVTGKNTWHASTIDKMLSNEKYMGDALLQKTYTVDFLTKKKVKNQGIVPQYYIEDNHEPIIPKELFYRVQEEKMRRSNQYRPAVKKREKQQKGKYSSKYALSDLLICGECGQPYRRQVWSKYGQKQAVWRCDNRLKHGSKYCKNSPTLKETILHEGIMKAIHRVVEQKGDFVQAFRENVIRIIGSYSKSKEWIEYERQLTLLQREMLKRLEETTDTEFEEEYHMFVEQMKELKQKQINNKKEYQLSEMYERRVEELEHYIKKIPYLEQEYDDTLVRNLIRQIKILNENKIELHFQSGILMVQRIDIYE